MAAVLHHRSGTRSRARWVGAIRRRVSRRAHALLARYSPRRQRGTHSFVEFRKGQAYVHKIQINEYSQANRWGHDIERVRMLLLHKHEIDKLATKVSQKGFTLIPLALYFKGHRVKIELGLVTHKKLHDKREAKRRADDQREIDRAPKRHGRE